MKYVLILFVVPFLAGCGGGNTGHDTGADTVDGIADHDDGTAFGDDGNADRDDGEVTEGEGAAGDADSGTDTDTDGTEGGDPCGDGSCSGSENAATCPDDCPAACGDALCTHAENASTCPADCPAVCPDGFCTHAEDALTCPDDCPECTPEGVCGFATVDVRDHWTQDTPGFQMCLAGLEICIDGRLDPASGEWMIVYTHGIRDFGRRDPNPPYLFGIVRNQDTVAGWRCFATAGQPCGASSAYPPQAVPLVMGLPVLRASLITLTGVTRGATLIPEYEVWRPFDIHTLDPLSCGQSGEGTVWHRVFAFVADAVDFGGDVGVQYNVLVLEEEQSGPQPDATWAGGQRLERYFLVHGFGRIREEGMESAGCRASPGPAECNGIYAFQGTALFNRRVEGDLAISNVCPY